MQELAVPEVDADVRKRPVQGIEENEVARHQLLLADLISGLGHLGGGSGQGQPHRRAKDLFDESATIKTARFGAVSPSPITGTQITKSRVDQRDNAVRGGGNRRLGTGSHPLQQKLAVGGSERDRGAWWLFCSRRLGHGDQ